MNQPMPGRGAQRQVTNRFESIEVTVDPTDEIPGRPKTQFFADQSKSIVTQNDSPDVPFRYSLNPYRGCEHGCSYCYARPTHEFLGMSAGLDFETKIIVKEKAVQLLRDFLAKPSYEPDAMMLSGVTDPYQPVERDRKITHGLLQLLSDCCHPIGLITKNALIERDVDILAQMARQQLVHVAISVTTLDPQLANVLEPRTSAPAARLRAIGTLASAGIPVRVMTAPVIPGLNDHELPQILEAAAEAGATAAAYVMLRLPGAVESVFCDWLANVRPEVKDKVLAKVREVRDGELNDTQFGRRMRGMGVRADSISNMFTVCMKKYGLTKETEPLCYDLFTPPSGRSGQLNLF